MLFNGLAILSSVAQNNTVCHVGLMTVQMETDFSAVKTRNSNSDFLGPRNYKATAMHHGKCEWVFKVLPGTPRDYDGVFLL